MTAPDQTRALIEKVVHKDWGRLLAALIASLRDFQLAEECLQDALESALHHWPRGLPRNPSGWLMQTARRKAIDKIRRDLSFQGKVPDIALLMEEDAVQAGDPPDIPDERLRLIFTACHPALDQKTRLALTLRTLCGLTTGEIARAFLDKDSTMAQRLARARAKIAKAAIPYSVPGPEDWDDRLNSVLTVIYLIFNEGYSASSGEAQVRHNLCDEALFLARSLHALRSDAPEISGLLALLLLGHARHHARLDGQGASVPLDQQDRGLWDMVMISEGLDLVETALRRGRPGPFQLQAAISAIHAEAERAEDTNWGEIVLIYNRLWEMTGNRVVLLNRAVALSFAKGPEQGLAALPDGLDDYQSFHAARADMLRRLGQETRAIDAYDQALALTANHADRLFLENRRRTLAKKKAEQSSAQVQQGG